MFFVVCGSARGLVGGIYVYLGTGSVNVFVYQEENSRPWSNIVGAVRDFPLPVIHPRRNMPGRWSTLSRLCLRGADCPVVHGPPRGKGHGRRRCKVSTMIVGRVTNMVPSCMTSFRRFNFVRRTAELPTIGHLGHLLPRKAMLEQ